MKKRVFKYKSVYWISLFINFVTIGIFGFASANRLSVKAFSNFRDLLFSATTFSIAISATLSLIFLFSKNRKAVKAFCLMLILLLVTFSLGITDSIVWKRDFDYDIITVSVILFMYLVTFGFLYMANRFKTDNDFRLIEIDEIGVRE